MFLYVTHCVCVESVRRTGLKHSAVLDAYRRAFGIRRRLVQLRDSDEQAGVDTSPYQTACIHIRSRCMFLLLYVSSAVQSEEAFVPLSFSGKKRGSTGQEDVSLRAETPPRFEDQEQARSPGSQVEASKKMSTPARMSSIPDSGGFKDDGALFPGVAMKVVGHEPQESVEGEPHPVFMP